MSRALLILTSRSVRERAIDWINRAPPGTRVEFKAAQRSVDQNSRLWAMLSDVAIQKTHAGRRYTADQWKVLFLHACGREIQFLPALDNSTFLPYGQSSSDLSKQEFSELLDFVDAWGSQNAVVWSEPKASQESAA
jgi:hypothetical protein